MPTKYLTTYIYFPPGVPPSSKAREFFQLAFAQFRWFEPVHYGRANLKGELDPAHIDYEALAAYYEEYKYITVTARTDRDFFMLWPAKTEGYPYVGKIVWETSVTEARKASWRAKHIQQVAEVMRLFDSPLAQVALSEDLEHKTRFPIPEPDGFGYSLGFTVRDYSEGLAGLFWRNFFGPPFVRLFGERLATLPADTRQELGDGLVLVQPYALPSQAGTPEALVRERELIAHLGPECFYNHELHLKPTRLPELAPAPAR